MLVALDRQTALVVGGEVHRTNHPITAALTQPRLGGVVHLVAQPVNGFGAFVGSI